MKPLLPATLEILSAATTAMLAASVLFIAATSHADVCADWQKRCASIDEAREDLVRRQPELLLPANPYEKPLIKNKIDARETFFATLDHVAFDTRAFQIADAKAVAAELAHVGIKEISIAKLKGLFLTEGSTYDQHLADLRARAKAWSVTKPDLAFYPMQSASGTLSEVRVSLLGFDKPRNWQRFSEAGLDILAKLESDDARFRYLLAQLNARVEMPSLLTLVTNTNLESPWNPQVARVLFVELIRDHYIEKLGTDFKGPFSKFLAGLQLKLNNASPVSQVESKDPLDITIHDGYYLGGPLPAAPKTASSNGTDCSSFVQFGLEKAGLPKIGERYTTAAMLAFGGKYQKIFTREPLHCEAELALGDVIVQDGHAVVFRGYYRNQQGSLRAVSTEAKGYEIGEVGFVERDMYLGHETCGTPRLIHGENMPPIYIYRPRWPVNESR